MAQWVITAVGLDRPGLVDQLSGRLLELGGNVADARMVNLRGQFALLMLAEAPDDAPPGLGDEMTAFAETLGLTLHLSPQAPPGESSRPGVPFRLRTYAMDQPGIVHRITHVLHDHGANIEELQTRLEPGSYTGTPLFTMELEMALPPGEPGQVKALRQELEALCDSLNCDVDLQPA